MRAPATAPRTRRLLLLTGAHGSSPGAGVRRGHGSLLPLLRVPSESDPAAVLGASAEQAWGPHQPPRGHHITLPLPPRWLQGQVQPLDCLPHHHAGPHHRPACAPARLRASEKRRVRVWTGKGAGGPQPHWHLQPMCRGVKQVASLARKPPETHPHRGLHPRWSPHTLS